MPFSTSPNTGQPAPTSSPSASEGPCQAAVQRWEEPHPGQRIPGLIESLPPSWTQRYAGVGAAGDFRNGMAAKGYHDHRGHRYRIQRPFMVRRDVRIRRNPKTATRRSETLDKATGGSSGTPVNMESLPDNATEARPIEYAGGDGDTATITEAEAKVEVATTGTDQTLVPSTSRSSRCTLGDVSNLLGICEEGDDGRPATALGPREPNAGPCEDVYGWEAELDRKMLVDDQEKDSPAFHSLATSVRRSNHGARKLIHRVFSIGPSSAAGEVSSGRRASTAN